MPWTTTAPISSGREAKHAPISRMMPSLSALRLAGRFRPTVKTRSTRSILNSPEAPASAVSAFPCVICVLVRIVMLYNEFWGSQQAVSKSKGAPLDPEDVGQFGRDIERDAGCVSGCVGHQLLHGLSQQA